MFMWCLISTCNHHPLTNLDPASYTHTFTCFLVAGDLESRLTGTEVAASLQIRTVVITPTIVYTAVHMTSCFICKIMSIILTVFPPIYLCWLIKMNRSYVNEYTSSPLEYSIPVWKLIWKYSMSKYRKNTLLI